MIREKKMKDHVISGNVLPSHSQQATYLVDKIMMWLGTHDTRHLLLLSSCVVDIATDIAGSSLPTLFFRSWYTANTQPL